jgi:hypothetical protein
MRSMTSAGGVPSAFAMSFTFGCLSATSTCGVAGRGGPAEELSHRAVAFRQLRHTVVGEDLVGELAVLLRAPTASSICSSCTGSISPMPSYLPGITMSTPYGLSPTCSSIHLSSTSSWLGREADGAEHAEAAGA